MAALTHASRACLRATSSSVAAPVRALSTTAVRNDNATPWNSYSSPFKVPEGKAGDKASYVPDFGKYASTASPAKNKLFQYFMVGGMGAITAAGAKSTVQGGWLPRDRPIGIGKHTQFLAI